MKIQFKLEDGSIGLSQKGWLERNASIDRFTKLLLPGDECHQHVLFEERDDGFLCTVYDGQCTSRSCFQMTSVEFQRFYDRLELVKECA